MMNPESKIMEHTASAKHEALATVPCRIIKVNHPARHILHLLEGQRIIIYSWDGSFRTWNLETGTQVGEEWEDKDRGVEIIKLSPGGKKAASWSSDGTVKLWNVDKGKVTRTWTGHTNRVRSLSWSLDGGRLVSGSKDGTFRVLDVKSGETILGPINTGKDIDDVRAVCYSPNAKMIAAGGNWNGLTIWDASSGELLKSFKGVFSCLAWISDGKTLVAGGWNITKIDTATWTVLDLCEHYADTVLLSPNDRILASTLLKTAQLWDLETNQPIGTPLHHQEGVKSATFSADGKFLVTSCIDNHLYTWDVSTIVKRAGFPSDIADITLPKMKGARQIPPGFFDDALREANLRIRLSQSHAPPTPTPQRRTLSPFTSVWQRYRPHGTTESATQSRSQPFSWTRNLSGILRRRDQSDIQLQEVEVPCTAGKPRNYHAKKKKPAASSSRPPNTYTTQQPSKTAQNTLSQLPPPVTTASTLSAVPGTTGATGTVSHPHITGAGWRASFVAWICCMPIKNAEGCH